MRFRKPRFLLQLPSTADRIPASIFAVVMGAVVVVLLAIYIVSIPMFVSIPVDPPRFQTGTLVNQSVDATSVLIGPRNELYFDDYAVRDEEHLVQLMRAKPQPGRLRLRADKTVSMDTINRVIRAAQRAGITEIEFVREVGVDDLRPFGPKSPGIAAGTP